MANGSFFPIIDEEKKGKKRLTLTTVQDDQSSMQIDLYRGAGPELENAAYLGSLIIENIESAQRGDPEIELLLGIDNEGNLNAGASDKVTGEGQSLHVGLEALSEDGIYDVPDFELDESFGPDFEEEAEKEAEKEIDTTSMDEFSEEEDSYGVPYGETAVAEETAGGRTGNRRIHPLLLIGFIILGLAIVGLIAFLLFLFFQGEPVPPLEARRGEAVVQTADDGPEEPAAVPESETGTEKPPGEEVEEPAAEPATAKTPAEAAAEKKTAESGIAREDGVWYTIKWGDTLWDISRSFYRTPWYYGMLARENNIKDPDRIYAGTRIFIPDNT
jgi:hypothetical protein